MKLVWGHDETVWRWADRRYGNGIERPTLAVGVIDRNGVLRGALLLDEENRWTVELTVFSEQALSNDIAKQFMRAVFSRYWRLQASTTPDNKAVKKAAIKWGFKFESTAKGFFGPNRDALRYGMTADQCRWLHPKQRDAINEKTEGTRADRRGQGSGRTERPEHPERAAERGLQSAEPNQPVRQLA